MSQRRIALLEDRAVVRVDGSDAEKLLQQLVTNDLPPAESRRWAFAALLTPQGKVLFDFLIARHDGGFLLDTAADKAAELVRRLHMYRLRARVEIADASAQYVVQAVWSEPAADLDADGPMADRLDPRLADLGLRIVRGSDTAQSLRETLAGEANAVQADYHAHRIALGVPEGGKDYAFGDTFPHEANLDLLNGVSFTKGCFIGQEVVARMKHRGTARRRVVPVEAAAPLRTGAAVTAGGAEIGRVGSVAGTRGLAMVRLDRAAEAAAKGQALLADGIAMALRTPPGWAGLELAPSAAGNG
jgi:folate-binding protein YgfZ